MSVLIICRMAFNNTSRCTCGASRPVVPTLLRAYFAFVTCIIYIFCAASYPVSRYLNALINRSTGTREYCSLNIRCCYSRLNQTHTVMIRIIFLVTLVGLVTGCDFRSKEVAELKAQADSLRYELHLSSEVAQTLAEVGIWIDSIDANRNYLRANAVEGVPMPDYVNRLQDINRYVATSLDKIDELEKSLQQSKSSQSKNLASIKQLRKELEEKGSEIERLTAQVTNFQNENANLMNTIALTGAELNDKMEQLTARQAEVTQLQAEVKRIVEQSKFDMAEAYFAQAQALEEAARRTKLAPRKKKNTQREALELYRLSMLTGKAEAQQKIEQLEKDI